jgi:hypothetical protein
LNAAFSSRFRASGGILSAGSKPLLSQALFILPVLHFDFSLMALCFTFLNRCFVFILEPMIATAGTMTQVIQRIVILGSSKIFVISTLISEVAKKKLEQRFPMVRFHVADIDPVLNSKGYIVPGLGDAGDRAFNM